MYKIFINEKPFIIAGPGEQPEARFNDCSREKYDAATLTKLIRETETMKSKGLVVEADDVEDAFAEFTKHFVAIEAAGGVVFNSREDILLIKRLGKWDLPKGKIDSGEDTDEAAKREVMEECGVSGLTIERKLPQTYHTYKMHNHRFLKITHWYRMHTDHAGKLVPQTEEHITEAVWVNWKGLDADSLDTYCSIRELLLSMK